MYAAITHKMPRRRRRLAAWIALLGLCACAPVATTSGGTKAPEPVGTRSNTLGTANTAEGAVLTGPNGRTVYVLFSPQDTPLACTGACTSAWPPATVTGGGSPTAGSGVTATLAVTTASQLSANGDPLYYYSADSGPGQLNGQGIPSFGGTWEALQPDGSPLPLTSPTAAPTAASSTGGSSGSSR